MIYCLVPYGSAEQLVALLRAHYDGQPGIEVIVDRRGDDRRIGLDGGVSTPLVHRGPPDRRSSRYRRRPVFPRELAGDLPDEIAAHAVSLRWVQRLAPVRCGLERVDLDGLLKLVSLDHDQALSELCWRYFARVAARASGLLEDPLEAEEATRRSFGRLFDQLPDFNPGQGSFEVLVDAAVDAVARDRHAQLDRAGRHAAPDALGPFEA